MNQQQQQIQIKITDDVLKGAYANFVMVGHTKEEFILDFISVSPGQGQGIVTAKVFLAPGHMKRLLAALQENIKKYEAQHGTIAEAEASAGEGSIGFRTE